MLNRRSQNIIFLCKGRHSYENITTREALKRYMAITCYDDIEKKDVYNDAILFDIIREVVLDVMGNLDEGHHHQFIFNYLEAAKRYVDLDAWLVALELLQVREKNEETGEYEYINGFSQPAIYKETLHDDDFILMYPEFEEAVEYGKNFDRDENIIYDNIK